MLSRLSNTIRERKLNSRIWTFVLCLAISALFWYLIALSESYSTTVSFPVRYKNLDKDLVLMNELPNHLSLNIKSRGFNLMSYRYLTNIEPIIIDISDLKERRLGKFSYRYMTTSGIKTSIANQIKGKVEVMDVSPDTLHFEFDRKRKKTVPVRLVRNFEFEPQYQVYGDILILPNIIYRLYHHICINFQRAY